jgi:aspartyl protease family protein
MLGLDDHDSARFVYLGVLLVLLLGSLAFGRSRGGGTSFRYLGIWLLIAIGLVTVYAYRAPMLRLAAPVMQELVPAHVVEVTSPGGERELLVARANDGHFHLDGKANDASVRFLVDTGASTTALTFEDAARSGIDVDRLAFNRPVQTANGTTFYAGATLGSLAIGPYRISDVPVAVMPNGAMDTSLLGMSTIDRFSSWRIEGDQMVLVP